MFLKCKWLRANFTIIEMILPCTHVGRYGYHSSAHFFTFWKWGFHLHHLDEKYDLDSANPNLNARYPPPAPLKSWNTSILGMVKLSETLFIYFHNVLNILLLEEARYNVAVWFVYFIPTCTPALLNQHPGSTPSIPSSCLTLPILPRAT